MDSVAFLTRDSLTVPAVIMTYREIVPSLDSIGIVRGQWNVEACDNADYQRGDGQDNRRRSQTQKFIVPETEDANASSSKFFDNVIHRTFPPF